MAPDGLARRADLSLRILGGLVRYVEERHGADAADRVLSAGGVDRAAAKLGEDWASLEQVEAVFASARGLMSSDDEFRDAFAHRLIETLGPLRFLAWAVSPRVLFTHAFSSVGAFSTISSGEVLERGADWMRVRYASKRSESRLMCLSRQGQARALPTLWGLPAATFEEIACIGRGDQTCEYVVRWHQQYRWVPVVVGAVLAGVTSAVPLYAGWMTPGAGGLAVALGAALGIAYELSRTLAPHRTATAETQAALRELARENAQVHADLLEQHERLRAWSALLESTVQDRTASLEAVIERIRGVSRDRRDSLVGVSHDFKQPLSVLRSLSDQMRVRLAADPEAAEFLEDHGDAVQRLQRMVDDLVRLARSETDFVRNVPEPISVADLADALRRRLAALAYGKGVAISVFATREAPEAIELDRVIFDRIIDNLLSNAAKYTDRGSIVLEITGTPGVLTLKLSDTGRGIPADQLDRIFLPEGSDPSRRAPQSHGLGLSVAVRLLAQVGGKLEILSRPGVGTTFWAHFPVRPPSLQPEVSAADALRGVVSIRKVFEA